MGLIKATFNAVGGTLGDSFLDYIKCDSLDNNVLVEKVTTKNGVLSNKSRIQVSPGQVALIFDSGKIVDATAEEGIYTFDNSTSPSLFAGEFGKTFKEMWERFKFGGAVSKEQAVFYVNTKEIIDNKFGSSSPVAYNDPQYRNIYIRYHGVYSFKIVDPFMFVSSIAGNVAKDYTKEMLMNQISAEFVSALDVAINNCSKEMISFSNLPGEQLRLAKHMNEVLDDKWKVGRGLILSNVAIEKITPDEESRDRIEEFDSSLMYSKGEMAAGRMVSATASAMEKAASNENGAATGLMGVGILNNMSSNTLNNSFDYIKNNEKKETKKCPKCGAEVTGIFCSQCGEKLESEKFCSNCGKKVVGNFCSECGTKAN